MPANPTPTNGPRGTRPKSKHRKNAPARQHRAMPKAVQTQAGAMTHHDSLPGDDIPQMTQNDSPSGDDNPRMTQNDSPSGDDNPRMTQNDSPSGDDNPRMTQNDSLCKAPNPEMTQNDSLCKASMTQMSQNDSHFEVSSFEMSQNDSFSGLKCPTEHPLSVADESPATPPSPPNDTLDGDPSAAGHPFAAGPLPQGTLLVASSCFRRCVILGGAEDLTHIRETLYLRSG